MNALSPNTLTPERPLPGSTGNRRRFWNVVSSRPETRREDEEMICRRTGKFSQDEFRARLAAALRRRLQPNTTLQPKQLAHAIGVSVDTILNWSNGYSDPSSYRIGLLLDFFSDPHFWAEVYGPIGSAMQRRFAMRREADLARAAQEEAALHALTGSK